MRRLMASVVSLVLVGAVPAQGAAIDPEWTIRPAHAAITIDDPYTPATTYTAGISVDGGLQSDGRELYLQVNVDTDDPNVALHPVTLVAPVELLTRPRAVRLGTSSPIFFRAAIDRGGCQDARGWLDIEDVGLDAAGRVVRLSLDYATTCDQTLGMAHGSVRWGYSEDSVAPVEYSFAPTPIDDWHGEEWVTVPDSAVWSPTGVRVEGTNAGDFLLVGGLLCHQFGPCEVPVRFVPQAGGYRRATLVLEGGGRTARVPLEGVGLPGVTRVTTGESTITPRDGYVGFTATGYLFRGEATADAYDMPSYDFTMRAPPEQTLAVGTRYVDTGDTADGTDISIARRQDGGSPWIDCGSNYSKGWFEFRRLFRRDGDAPAYAVDYSYDCNGSVLQGTIEYGDRTDLADPATARDLRLTGGDTLTWSVPADAVTSVVRARRGGLGTPTVDTGERVYAGPAERVTLPDRQVGRATSYTVFTVDAVGNVSSPTTVVGRGGTAMSLARDGALLGGVVTDAGWGFRLSGRSLALQARRPGGSWRTVQTTAADRFGRYEFGVSTAERRDLRIRAAATPTHRVGTSRVVSVG